MGGLRGRCNVARGQAIFERRLVNTSTAQVNRLEMLRRDDGQCDPSKLAATGGCTGVPDANGPKTRLVTKERRG